MLTDREYIARMIANLLDLVADRRGSQARGNLARSIADIVTAALPFPFQPNDVIMSLDCTQ